MLVKLDHLSRDRGENKKIFEVSPPRVVNGSKLVGSPTSKGVYWGYNPLTNHLLTSWDIHVGERECIFNLKILRSVTFLENAVTRNHERRRPQRPPTRRSFLWVMAWINFRSWFHTWKFKHHPSFKSSKTRHASPKVACKVCTWLFIIAFKSNKFYYGNQNDHFFQVKTQKKHQFLQKFHQPKLLWDHSTLTTKSKKNPNHSQEISFRITPVFLGWVPRTHPTSSAPQYLKKNCRARFLKRKQQINKTLLRGSGYLVTGYM